MARIAVLASGGLDSAVLLADLARENTVFPVYIQAGLHWEARERRALDAYLAALHDPNVEPLTVLEMPVRSLYGAHWSTTGEGVPEYDEPDEAVYLPGRNVLLIGVTAVWCALNDVSSIAIGSLDDNPFPDATPAFYADYGRLLSGALAHPLEVMAPYRRQHKSEIIARFPELPLHLTLTCMAPIERDGVLLHCGGCNKCRERREAFRDAGVPDKTPYAS
ncbi:MAG TPA: 7-cyano-7-deazaguanine synthase [Dehalococcoidia bacterium]|nr:7-cyano-7-deazaguanine synthase [Dehalococcoidia bacterium]